MKTLIPILGFALYLASGHAFAQPFPPNEAGVTMGHWHLASRDVEANRKIFVAMGGKRSAPGDFDIVTFPGVVVNLHLREKRTPPTGGTVGPVVNHVGFTVKNVQEQVAKWKAGGRGGCCRPASTGPDQAFVETPDGLRIEILEDKSQAMPIQHEHIHFFLPEAALTQSQAWYAKHFGAKAATRNKSPVADIPGVQLRFAKVEKPQLTTKGTVLDHIGFDVKDLKAFISKLEAAGIKLGRPFTPRPGGGLAFITDPWGTLIELNERPTPVYLPSQ